MSSAWWGNNPKGIDYSLTIRAAVKDLTGRYPFAVAWKSANLYNVTMEGPGSTHEQSYYTYLIIDGKAVRQN